MENFIDSLPDLNEQPSTEELPELDAQSFIDSLPDLTERDSPEEPPVAEDAQSFIDSLPDLSGTAKQEPTEEYTPQVQEGLTSANISDNKEWLEAARVVYNMGRSTANQWTGSDEDLSYWALEEMGAFENNLGAMMWDVSRVNRAQQHEKEAFLHLMETYPQVDEEFGEGLWRFAKNAAWDITNWIGVGTLGYGLAAKTALKVGTKQTFKDMLKKGMVRTGTIGALDGATIGYAVSSHKESVRVAAGAIDEKRTSVLLRDTGIGFVAGLTLGTALDVGGQAIAKKVKAKMDEAKKLANVKTKEAAQRAKEIEQEVKDLKKELAEQTKGKQSADAPKADAPEKAQPDDVPANNLEAAEVIDGMEVDIPYFNTALTNPIRDKSKVVARADELVRKMSEIGADRFRIVAARIKASALTVESRGNLQAAEQIFRDAHFRKYVEVDEAIDEALLNGDKALALDLQKQKDELSEIIDIADDLYSVDVGEQAAILGQRNNPSEGLVTGVKYSRAALKALPANAKKTDEEIEELRDQLIREAIEKADVKKIEFEYKQKLEQLRVEGDYAGYVRTKEEMKYEIEARVSAKANAFKEAVRKKAGEAYIDVSQKTTELAISNLFSASTLVYNATASTIKTLYRPLADFVVGGDYSKRARVDLFYQYAQLKALRSTSLQLAKANFKYEKQIATYETNRLLEAPSKIKGKTGSLIRTIPKAMLWTDGLLQDINYRTYVASEAAVSAYDEGIAKGLKDKALDKFIKKKVKSAIDKSYDTEIVDNTIKAIYEKGVVKGFKGDELHQWVQNAIQKDKDLLKTYNNSEGIKYSNDMLFKTPFSGKSAVSRRFQDYETIMQKHPLAKFITNMFFRTPVRLIEEGVRLTPALQMASGKFRRDLLGENGRKAQARARGEFVIAQALLAETMIMYAEGNITGGSHPEHPYSIKDSNGEWWSYRLFDPFSTPVKMMVNALDNYNLKQMRMYQEDGFEDPSYSDEFMTVSSSALVGILVAIKDVNLLQGFEDLYDFGKGSLSELTEDPNKEADESQNMESLWWGLLGKKMEMLVPKQAYKLYAFEDPTFYSPVDHNQTLTKMGLPFAEVAHPLLQPFGIDLDPDAMRASIPKRYSALGVPAQLPNPLAWNIAFAPTNEDDYYKGFTEDEKFVDKALTNLEHVLNTKFRLPYKKNSVFGGTDLRTMYTTNNREGFPRETYYDRWLRIYREQTSVTEELKEFFSEEDGFAVGVPDYSPLLTEVSGVINRNRQTAWEILEEEEGLLTLKEEKLEEQVDIEEGQRDIDTNIFKQ